MEIVTRPVPETGLEVDEPLLRRIYAARGVRTALEVDSRLAGLHGPDKLPDVEKAASRLADAITAGEKILIVGDFDADGATSVALCMLVLGAFGARAVDFIVPNRFEFGYGLSPEIVVLAQQLNPDVIVTVDNGISSVSGVAQANEAGIDVIVTDHHLPGPVLPAAHALVNPNLHGSDFESGALAGVGVAYYLLGQLRSELRNRDWFVARGIEEPNLAQYLDLVALGTVADVVPLDRNNRILVKQGLARIRAGRCRPGIRALIDIAKRSLPRLNARDLGFAVGPRLNAAGRLEDMAIGIRCLLAEDLGSARQLASALDQLNKTRQELQAEMVDDAQVLLAEKELIDAGAGVSVYHESFHQGIVGIVAGRLRERMHRPAIVFADSGDLAPDELKGSARSIEGLHIRDLLDEIATSHPGLLIKFGGHAMAAGLSIKRVHFPRFSRIFDKAVRDKVSDDMLMARIVTDGSLDAPELTLTTAEMLARAGPWGSGFPEPSFHGDFELVSQRIVGEKHLKLVLRTGGSVVDAIAFQQPPLEEACKSVRAVYTLQPNEYRDISTLQLVVEYLEPLP